MARSRSAESWGESRRRVVEALESGRITGKEVMEELGVSAGTLGGWVRAEQVRRERSVTRVAPFVAVDVREDVGNGSPRRVVVVVLRNGRRLRVPAGFDAGEVARLVRALESC